MNRQRPDFLKLPVFSKLMEQPQTFADDFQQLPPRMRQNLVRIVEDNTNHAFPMSALTGHGSPNEDMEEKKRFTTAAPDLIATTFAEIFPTAFPTTTTAPFRLRLPERRPPQVMQVKRPLQEVTFERVTETTTSGECHSRLYTSSITQGFCHLYVL